MPRRTQLIDEINRENGYGVFLMAQMDSVPETLQFVIATTEYDEAAGGLRDLSRYVVRCVGVHEHRVSIGMFGVLAFNQDHPLLYEINTTPAGLFFRGKPEKPAELVLDIFQSYASMFGPWRQIPQYLNTSKPLLDLVSGGGDLLGEMPYPLAERLERVLQHHKLETRLIMGERPAEQPSYQALLLDDSYVVAQNFTVEELGKAG
jgi:hypothetical protein